ncbi:MAG TPA: hypothetical protein O0X19_03355 [Methanocorpusculum sp.]|nr:hypothetical protein [Candidatus Methanocorpusculum equi]MCQ2358097.1 hypothetical protein [Methanocorpusculum sp.]HJJ33399.1 hypothetical protein [Methanocorpusculum sp.]HJJ44720.1 hypothetical protein [Methanocorpusculum sp.]HJJ59642.1 hypothetical protein [Methanocorpusculum sp.]
MGSEAYQAQVLRAFFDTITGTDRNLTRVYLCVITVAKLRGESPEKLTFLKDQMIKSRAKHELSVDILDYMVDAANSLENKAVYSAFGIPESADADDFGSISLDSL